MREIKYKVYCKRHKREETYTLGDLICGLATMVNGEGGEFEHWREYTGLKDKNGKEIYEGDIILTQPVKDKPFSKRAKSKRLKGIVEYNVLCGKNFVSEPDKMKYWGAEWNVEIIDKKVYEKYHNFCWGLFFECEVIGNIYENPELLKEEIC